MASIVKRKNKWAVIYSCDDENGVKRQKWESFATNAEAKKRKAQIEFQQATGTFIVPSAKTVAELLSEYVSTYGINTWAASTYESKRGLIDNYVLPIIGDVRLDDVNPRMMNSYYQKLLTVKARSSKFVHPQNEFVTVRTVKEIHKVLRNAFNQAVKWELFFLLALVPFVRYAVISNHSALHPFMTYRDLLISIVAVSMGLALSVRVKKAKPAGKKGGRKLRN